MIPTTRFDPVAASLLSYIPLPNGEPDAAGTTTSSRRIRARISTTRTCSRSTRILPVISGSPVPTPHNGRHEIRAKNGREELAAPGGNHYRWNDQFDRGPELDVRGDAGLEPESRVDDAQADRPAVWRRL